MTDIQVVDFRQGHTDKCMTETTQFTDWEKGIIVFITEVEKCYCQNDITIDNLSDTTTIPKDVLKGNKRGKTVQ